MGSLWWQLIPTPSLILDGFPRKGVVFDGRTRAEVNTYSLFFLQLVL
jgi:hypothetical protein